MLLASDGARNIHRLREIREAAPNMPAVQAIDRLIELDAGERSRASQLAQAHPGVTINVVSTKPMVDVSPNACAIRAVDEKGE
jgi:hypothetical protein